MIDLFAFLLSLLAFNCFALAKNNHFKDVFNTRPSAQQRKLLLAVAWINILLSLALCVSTQGSYGTLLFFGYTNLSALIIMIFCSFLVKYIKLLSTLTLIAMIISAIVLAIN